MGNLGEGEVALQHSVDDVAEADLSELRQRLHTYLGCFYGKNDKEE